MYKTTVQFKSIWNDTVVNQRKDGSHYIVKSWIMGNFDNRGKLIGFTSVRQDITKLLNSLKEVDRKNSYLEHAAKILRHDMHSGINTYIPRGLTSLKRRINDEKIKELRIESPIKLLEEGLHHAQKVYEGVKEFTNLVKDDVKIHKETYDLKNILDDYLRSTSYKDRVKIDELGKELVNRLLFCTAVDNLIRNGLKYNDHPTKLVEIYKENGDIIIRDNGRGMTPKEFEELKKPYVRKNNKEKGTGLGLNICSAILGEHGFSLSCERVEEGTKLKITFNK
jgi:signal transduction histidine kinase